MEAHRATFGGRYSDTTLRTVISKLRQCVTLIENKFLENSHVQTLAPHGAMVLR